MADEVRGPESGAEAGRAYTVGGAGEAPGQLHALMDSSLDGILAYDTEFRLIVWNPAMGQLTGLRADEVLGRNAFEVFPFLEAVGEARAMRRAVEGEATVSTAQPFNIPDAGRSGYFESSHFPLRDGSGEITGGMGMVRDVTARYRAEEERWAAEQKYRLISEQASDMIALLSGADLTCLYVNPAMIDALGYEQDELIGRSLADIIHPEDVDRARRSMSMDRSMPVELRYQRPGAPPLWASVAVSHADSGQGTHSLLVVSRDITPQKRAEEALRAARDRAQQYLDVAGVIIVVLNVQGRVMLVNEYGCEMLGYPERDIVGYDWFELFVPEPVRERARERFAELMAGEAETAGYFEIPLLTRGRGERLISWHDSLLTDDDGRIVGTVSSGSDVTERHLAEEELLQREDSLRGRVRELGCLYKISRVLERRDISLEEVLQGIADLMPAGWRYPETACARVVLGDQEFRSERFGESQWRQSAPVMVHGAPAGSVEVRYLERRPEAQEGPFLSEERDLLNAIAERTGRIAERMRAQEGQRLSNVMLAVANRHSEAEPLLVDCIAEVRRFTGCAAVGLRLLNEDGGIPYHCHEGFDEEFYEHENALSIECDQCLCIGVITGNRDPELACYTEAGSVVINNTTDLLAGASEGMKQRMRGACNRFGYESVALVPIKLGGKTLGLIHVADPAPGRLPPARVALLETAAMALGPAIVRLRAEDTLRGALAESRRRQEQISALLSASRAVLEARTFLDASRSIFDTCKQLTGATAGYVALLAENGEEADVLFLDSGGRPCGVDPDLPMPIRGLRAEALQSGRPVYENGFADSKWAALMPPEHAKLDNVLFAPLLLHGEAMGLIGLANKPGGFTDEDADMAAAFGELASVALLNSRTHDALQESEARFRQLAENIREVFWISTADWSETLYTSPAFEELWGHTPETLHAAGMSWTDTIVEEDREALLADMARKAAGDYSNPELPEFRVRRPDGSVRWILDRAFPVRDEDGNVVRVTGIAEDITERKLAAEELRRQLAVSRALADLSNALLAVGLSIEQIADVVLGCAKGLTDSEHGYVASIDPETGDNVCHTFTPMLGSACQVTEEKQRIAFPAGPDGRYAALWGHALNTREAFFTNDCVSHAASVGLPEGHLPIHNFLTVPAIVGDELVGQVALANSAVDYTERDLAAIGRLTELYALAIQRARSQGALRESEEKYHSLYTTMNEGVALHEMVYDEEGAAVDYRITDINPAFEEITGLPRDHAVGRLATELYGTIEPPYLDTYARVAETGRAEFFETEFKPMGKHFRISVFSPGKGQFATVFADITRRRQMERALRRTRDRLETRVADRTAALVDANAHLRNEIAERRRVEEQLLTYQDRLRSLALEFLLVEERERRAIAAALHDRIGQALAVSKIKLGQLLASADGDELVEALREIRALVDQSITDARSVTFDLSPPVLYELGLDKAIEWLAEQMQEQHDLEIIVGNDGGTLQVSDDVSGLLFRAVRELLLNTVKHAGAGTARVDYRMDDDGISICVTDDGAGFDVQALQPENGPGPGFGLFSIRERLGHLGGSLSIESSQGAGTKATLRLPLKPSTPTENSAR